MVVDEGIQFLRQFLFVTAFGQQRDAIAHQTGGDLGDEIQEILRPIFRGALIGFQCPKLAGHRHGGDDFLQLRFAGPDRGFSWSAFGHFGSQCSGEVIPHHHGFQRERRLGAGVAVNFFVQLG